MTYKQCTKCSGIKPLSEFHKYKRAKDGRRGRCRVCTALYKAQYRLDHSDKIAEYQAQYCLDHRSELMVYNAQWREDHRDGLAKYSEQWSADNPEYKKQWDANNPEKIAAKDRRRRARKAAVICDLTSEQAAGILAQGCWFCDATEDLTLAHDIPIVAGGNTTRGNVTCLCRPCNSRMGTKSLSETIEQLSF